MGHGCTLTRQMFESSGSADNRPLHGRGLVDCRKLHCQLTDLGALCGSGEEEGFAGLTFLVGSANGLESGEREGPLAPP
jgi:hypothetical protein